MTFRHLAYPLFLGSIALILWGVAPAGATTYITGDLVITGTDARSDDTIDITGSVSIGATATVGWTNITLVFNSTAPDAHGLYIDGSVTFLDVRVTAAPGTTAWWFLVNSTATFEADRCEFSMMNGTAGDPGASGAVASTDFASIVGGVQVYSSNVHIGNSSIHDGLGANVFVGAASPRLDSNRIFDARYAPFEVQSTYAAPRQTSDWRAVAACVVLTGGFADLDTNRIENCGAIASANFTDGGSSGATEATSNIRLVGAGVVVLGGAPTLRQDGVLDVTAMGVSFRSFAWGGLNVTQYLYKLASWGVVLRNAAGASMSGGFVTSADTAIEVHMDGLYSGTAPAYTLFSVDFNGSYARGLVANFGGLTQQVALTVDQCNFGPASQAAVAVRFTQMAAAHYVTIFDSDFDQGTSATGVALEDQGSTVAPSFVVSWNTMQRLVAPVSIHLSGLSGGANLQVHNNTMNNTAGVYNGSATPYYRGGIDIRWLNLLGSSVSLIVEDNKVFNQTFSGTDNAGLTVWTSQSSAVTGSYFIQRNHFSNVSYGVHFYENFGGNAQSSAMTLRGNIVQSASNYGFYLYSLASGGNFDPAFDWNFVDHASSYGLLWYISQGNVAQRAFTNNTVYGYGTTQGGGLQFSFGNPQKWSFTLWDTTVFNTSVGLNVQQGLANVYQSSLTGTGTAVTCSECVVRLEETAIYPNSATVSGVGSEVTAYQRFGATRVQWQGDGGMPVTGGNLYLRWMPGPLTLATIALDATSAVANRSIPAWRSTQAYADRYDALTPFTRVGENDVAGVVLNFTQPYYGNVTILDPELPSLTITTPGAGAQVRVRAVHVKGAVADATTGVDNVQVSVDGASFAPADVFDPLLGLWEHTVNFPADGLYTIVVHAWDRARWNVTFGNFSAGYQEVNISGIVIDTVAPALLLTDPPVDITTKSASYRVTGQASDANGIADFVFTFRGNTLAAFRQPNGAFEVTVTNFTEGPNLITVLATDFAGNTNVLTRTIVLDTIAPHLIVTSPANNSFTNRAGVEVDGEVEQDVLLYINDIPRSLPFTFPLKQGVNYIWINATDRGQNRVSELRVVELDIVPPTLSFVSPARYPYATNDSHVVIQMRANEPIAELWVNGIAFPLPAVPPRNFTFDLYLEDGSHSILVRVTDRANNSMEVNAGPVVVDTVPPSLRIDAPLDGTVQVSRTIIIRGRTDPNAFINVTTQAGRFQTTDFNPITGAFEYTDTRTSDGVATYRVEATDGVGNTVAMVFAVRVDQTAPTIEVLGIAPEQVTQEEVLNFHGTVSPSSTLTLTVSSPDSTLAVTNQPVAVSCTAGPTADCTFSFNLKMAVGQTTVALLATDAAGNQAPREIHIKREAGASTQADPGASASGMVPLLAALGALIGLATLPLWARQLRSKAQAEHPQLDLAPQREAPKVEAPQPVAPLPIDEPPHDMYAQDALSRRPRAPRPPQGGA